MTAIAVIAQDGAVYMGSDRCVSWGDSKTSSGSPKIKMVGRGKRKMLIGAAGSSRACGLLTDHWSPPPFPRGYSVLRYMTATVPKSIQEMFDEAGLLPGADAEEWELGVVIGHEGRIYSLDSDFGVSVIQEDEFGEGSAGDVVAGALFASRGRGTPEERIKNALEAAAFLKNNVSPPFDILCLEGG